MQSFAGLRLIRLPAKFCIGCLFKLSICTFLLVRERRGRGGRRFREGINFKIFFLEHSSNFSNMFEGTSTCIGDISLALYSVLWTYDGW